MVSPRSHKHGQSLQVLTQHGDKGMYMASMLAETGTILLLGRTFPLLALHTWVCKRHLMVSLCARLHASQCAASASVTDMDEHAAVS